MHRDTDGRRAGFSLLELLLVVLIVILVIGSMLMLVQKLRRVDGDQMRPLAHLKAIIMAVNECHNTHNAAFFGETAARVTARAENVRATFLLKPDPDVCRPTPLVAHSFRQHSIPVSFMDGSTRFLSAKVSPEAWNAAVQPNDGVPLGTDFWSP